LTIYAICLLTNLIMGPYRFIKRIFKTINTQINVSNC
jgi:hypothetical protein